MNSENQKPVKSKKINTISLIKGIGIILIVVGHYFPAGAPEYWLNVRPVVTKFNVFLFFFLSGYLFRGVGKKGFKSHVKKKIHRLIYPFLSVALIYFFIKLLPGLFFKLAHPVTINQIGLIFVYPMGSYVPLIWFLYTLFLLFLIYPFFEHNINNKQVMFIISIALLLIPAPSIFCIAELLIAFPYFILGAMLSSIINFDKKINKLRASFIFFFGIALFFILYRLKPAAIEHSEVVKIFDFGLGVVGIMTCLAFAMIINQFPHSLLYKTLDKAGMFSMSIYLFHPLFMSSLKVFFYQIMKLNAISFEAKTFIAIVSGIIFPCLIEKYIFRKSFIAKKYILGM